MRMAPALALAVFLLPGCRGTVPERDGSPEQAISAVLIAGRMILPTGETRDGQVAINFEGEGDRRAEVYRLPVSAGQEYLYLIEPGTYRLFPTRSLLGFHQPQMKIVIDGRMYKVPFPREILRLPPFSVKPSKILTLGALEVRILTALPGGKPQIRVRLDDSVETRRAVVQSLIRGMMDPRRPADARESAISWSRQLEGSLMEILSEEEKHKLFKPAP